MTMGIPETGSLIGNEQTPPSFFRGGASLGQENGGPGCTTTHKKAQHSLISEESQKGV